MPKVSRLFLCLCLFILFCSIKQIDSLNVATARHESIVVTPFAVISNVTDRANATGSSSDTLQGMQLAYFKTTASPHVILEAGLNNTHHKAFTYIKEHFPQVSWIDIAMINAKYSMFLENNASQLAQQYI